MQVSIQASMQACMHAHTYTIYTAKNLNQTDGPMCRPTDQQKSNYLPTFDSSRPPPFPPSGPGTTFYSEPFPNSEKDLRCQILRSDLIYLQHC